MAERLARMAGMAEGSLATKEKKTPDIPTPGGGGVSEVRTGWGKQLEARQGESDISESNRPQGKPANQGRGKEPSQSVPSLLDMEIEPLRDLDKFKEMFKGYEDDSEVEDYSTINFGRGGFNNRGNNRGRGRGGGSFGSFSESQQDENNFGDNQNNRGLQRGRGNDRGRGRGREGFGSDSAIADFGQEEFTEPGWGRGGGNTRGRGGFDSQGGGRGGFDDSQGRGRRGGFENSQGRGRGGFENSLGRGRGGFESGQRRGRGGFESSQGGRGRGRGGFDTSQGRGFETMNTQEEVDWAEMEAFDNNFNEANNRELGSYDENRGRNEDNFRGGFNNRGNNRGRGRGGGSFGSFNEPDENYGPGWGGGGGQWQNNREDKAAFGRGRGGQGPGRGRGRGGHNMPASDQEALASSNTEARAGDWACPNPGCRNHNFSWRPECKKCGAPKPGENNAYTAPDLPEVQNIIVDSDIS